MTAANPVQAPEIPGYRDVTLISTGSTSLVFRAVQSRLSRTVAIKVLLVDGDGTTHAQYQRELETTVLLSSQPHIVGIIDTGATAAGQPYIVMEYCPGGSYAQILKQRGPLPVDEVVDVGAKIAEALQAAHDVGVLHRDVKPSNILRSAFGPALADFGIARAAHQLFGTDSLDRMTPYHASPEAMRKQNQSPASDIYSLASTMWHLLTGRPPFADPARPPRDLDDLRQRVLHEPAPPVPRPDVPQWLQRELARALAKDPGQRHPSAHTFGRSCDTRPTGYARSRRRRRSPGRWRCRRSCRPHRCRPLRSPRHRPSRRGRRSAGRPPPRRAAPVTPRSGTRAVGPGGDGGGGVVDHHLHADRSSPSRRRPPPSRAVRRPSPPSPQSRRPCGRSGAAGPVPPPRTCRSGAAAPCLPLPFLGAVERSAPRPRGAHRSHRGLPGRDAPSPSPARPATGPVPPVPRHPSRAPVPYPAADAPVSRPVQVRHHGSSWAPPTSVPATSSSPPTGRAAPEPLLAVLATSVAVLLVAAVVVVALVGRPTKHGGADPAPSTTQTLKVTDQGAPTNVRLEDKQTSITLTWTDPSGSA